MSEVTDPRETDWKTIKNTEPTRKDANDSVQRWLSDNTLLLNKTKSYAMLLQRKATAGENTLNLHFRDSSPRVISDFKYLGVWLDTDLSFKTHIHKHYSKVLGLVSRSTAVEGHRPFSVAGLCGRAPARSLCRLAPYVTGQTLKVAPPAAPEAAQRKLSSVATKEKPLKALLALVPAVRSGVRLTELGTISLVNSGSMCCVSAGPLTLGLYGGVILLW